MSQRTNIDSPSFSKWKAGHVPKPVTVASFARAYGRPVFEAFVAAGFLSSEEAEERPTAAPDVTQLADEELVEEVRRRLALAEALRVATAGDDANANFGVGPVLVDPQDEDPAGGVNERTSQQDLPNAARTGTSEGAARRDTQDRDATGSQDHDGGMDPA